MNDFDNELARLASAEKCLRVTEKRAERHALPEVLVFGGDIARPVNTDGVGISKPHTGQLRRGGRRHERREMS